MPYFRKYKWSPGKRLQCHFLKIAVFEVHEFIGCKNNEQRRKNHKRQIQQPKGFVRFYFKPFYFKKIEHTLLLKSIIYRSLCLPVISRNLASSDFLFTFSLLRAIPLSKQNRFTCSGLIFSGQITSSPPSVSEIFISPGI